MKQILLSKLQASTVFNVDRLTIYNWIRRGCPIVDPGERGKPAKLDFKSVLAWRLEELRLFDWPEQDRLLTEQQAKARIKTLR